MTIRKFNLEYKEIWNAFNKLSKMPLFMFDRDYMEYHKERFNDHSLMFFNDTSELIAIFPASIKDDLLTSHGGLTYGGFIIGNTLKQHTVNELFLALQEYAQQHDIHKIIYKTIPHIYHKQGAEEDRYALFLNNAQLIKVEPSSVINLKDVLKMPKGRKAQVSRARREGVEIIESNDFETFIDLENEVLSEHHGTTAVHTGKELSFLKSYFPENIHLFGAYYKGQMIAGTVIYEYETVIHTQYMAANSFAREIGGLDLVISTIIEKYKESKNYLDFGISSEDGGKTLNEGLISQKEGFGGRTNVYETWKINLY